MGRICPLHAGSYLVADPFPAGRKSPSLASVLRLMVPADPDRAFRSILIAHSAES